MLFHLDADFLILALTRSGPQRERLLSLAGSDAAIGMSSIAWYEFCRGPRTAEHLAVARSFLLEDGILPFSEELADLAAELFRKSGASRRRAADIAIGITASEVGATLLTLNERDFVGIPGLVLESMGE